MAFPHFDENLIVQKDLQKFKEQETAAHFWFTRP
jgi:hypothetical protein